MRKLVLILALTGLVALAILAMLGRKDPVAYIGKQPIFRDEVEETLHTVYWDITLNQVLNERLLQLEAKQRGLRQNELPPNKGPEVDFNRQKLLREIIQGLLVTEVDDPTLKTFLGKKSSPLIVGEAYAVRIVQVDHQTGADIERQLKSGKKLEDMVRPNQIQSSRITHVDELFEDVHGALAGETVMVMAEDQHSLVVVDQVFAGHEAQWPNDRDEILKAYLQTNTGEEYMKLLARLRDKHQVQMVQEGGTSKAR